jgi:SAM-dependent methyltransferase
MMEPPMVSSCQTQPDLMPPRSERRHVNYLGTDLEPEDVDAIEALFGGKAGNLDAYREAQIRELAFWRWVAFEGYGNNDPRLFPLQQEHSMISTFYRCAWPMQDFAEARILEIGCGPLGMIKYIPAAFRVAYDPLNPKYSALFKNARNENIIYLSHKFELEALSPEFDLSICHNVIDHTEDPAYYFNALFNKTRPGGRFIFQVNLSKRGLPQPEEHRRMHPSPIEHEQILDWLKCKSADFSYDLDEKPTVCSEFYFLAWGTVTGNGAVSYQNRLKPW